MECPACHQLMHEHAPACPHCGFDLPAVERYFGIPPVLKVGLTDLAATLSPADIKKGTSRLHEIGLMFPQCEFSAVVVKCPAGVPLQAYVFWLFNRGGLVAPMDIGGDCRLVLFVIDVVSQTQSCMIGYGLEPFVPLAALQRMVDAAPSALQSGQWLTAILQTVEVAAKELAEVAVGIPKTFGVGDPLGTLSEC